jgi:hypothetical protein
MNEDLWWWAVYDDERDPQHQIISSNSTAAVFRNGEAARQAAVEAAREYLGLQPRRVDDRS